MRSVSTAIQSWWPFGLSVLGTVLPGVAAVVSEADSDRKPLWLALGVAIATAVVWIQAVQRRRQDRATQSLPEAERLLRKQLTLAVNNVFEPIAEAVGELLETPKPQRREVKATALTGVLYSACAERLFGAEGLRASRWRVNDARTEMWCEDYSGRAGKPTTKFLAGTTAGDEALRMIQDNNYIFCPDTSSPPRGFDAGSHHDYKTFISVPIRTSRTTYGMLTVDGPEPGDLKEEHVQLVRALAQYMAAIHSVRVPATK